MKEDCFVELADRNMGFLDTKGGFESARFEIEDYQGKGASGTSSDPIIRAEIHVIIFQKHLQVFVYDFKAWVLFLLLGILPVGKGGLLERWLQR